MSRGTQTLKNSKCDYEKTYETASLAYQWFWWIISFEILPECTRIESLLYIRQQLEMEGLKFFFRTKRFSRL